MNRENNNKFNENVGKHSKKQSTKKNKTQKKNVNKKNKDNGKIYNNFNNEFGMANKYKSEEKEKKPHKVLKIVLIVFIILFLIIGTVFGTYLYKAGGSFTGAVMNLMKDTIGDKDPIFVLIMGVSEDISAELTDTIMLAGFNPETNQVYIVPVDICGNECNLRFAAPKNNNYNGVKMAKDYEGEKMIERILNS